MLRAGKRISIQSKSIQCLDGELEAPEIRIHELILSASNGIHSSVKNFLENHGAKVEIIEKESDKLVRLSGKFHITRLEVSQFLKQRDEKTANPILSKAQSFREKLKAALNNPHAHMQILNVHTGEKVVCYKPSIMSAGKKFQATTPKKCKMKGIWVSANTGIKMDAGMINVSGVVIEDEIGFCNEFISGKDIDFTTRENTQIKNSMLFARRCLNIKAADLGSICLTMDTHVEFINKGKHPINQSKP